MKRLSNNKIKIREAKLPNGIALVHLHTKRDPVSACHLFLPGGTSQEAESESGLATLRWSLLMKGTVHRTARQLAEDIESLGASISAGVTHDYSEISCHAASPYFLSTLKIMGEVLFQPAFKNEEIKKEKEALIAAIRSKKESIFSTASEKLNKLIYDGHPYARPASGQEASVSSLEARHLFQWHEKNMNPSHAILAVASDLPFEKLRKEILAVFGNSSWPQKKKSRGPEIPQTHLPKMSAEIKLKEKFEQAFLIMGFPTAGITSKDYVAVKVLNACLGGGMSTRLFQELREKQGLAYDVGSYYPSKLRGSSFVIYMGLQAAKLEQARRRIEEILAEIQKDGVPEAELTLVKNYLKGSYLLDHQTNSQRSHYLGWWRILGKKSSYDRDYLNHINRVTSEQVRSIARMIFRQNPIVVEIRPEKTAATTGAYAA